MPAASKFATATPEKSGVVKQHIHDIHWVCQNLNTFLFVRPSTVATMRLIDAGFATKSMDIHDKSSDWGLTSGFVPVDQAFSKKLSGEPNPNIHPHGHGEAQAVHLTYEANQLNTLLRNNHFSSPTSQGNTSEVRGQGAGGNFRVFKSTRKASVHFLWNKSDGKVFWQLANKPAQKPTPVWVWGYNGVPVTGDYDMWMVAPHFSQVKGQTEIYSVKDAHGRSAASRFTIELMPILNRACNRIDKPVFNHGAEAQNASFTQALDRYLAVFPPGRMKPFMIPRLVLPGTLHDISRHGYLAVLNPKWIDGSTMGIEDMSAAQSQFPTDGAVRGGVAAMNNLRNAAGQRILHALDPSLPVNEKLMATWKERYNELRYFRALGNMPEPQSEDLVLPPTAFPNAGPGSTIDTDNFARKMSADIQNRFGRQGFSHEDGHVAPIDKTTPAQGSGHVAAMRKRFGG